MKKLIITILLLLFISLYGYSKKVYEVVANVKGQYELRKSIQDARKKDPNVVLEYHCTKYDNKKCELIILKEVSKKDK